MDIKPTRTFELKFKDPSLKDQTYYSIRYEFNPNEYTTPTIKRFCQEKSNQLQEYSPNGVFSISLKYGYDGQWRSGKRTKIGEPVSLWSITDSDFVEMDEPICGFDILFTMPKRKFNETEKEVFEDNKEEKEEKEEKEFKEDKPEVKKITTRRSQRLFNKKK